MIQHAMFHPHDDFFGGLLPTCASTGVLQQITYETYETQFSFTPSPLSLGNPWVSPPERLKKSHPTNSLNNHPWRHSRCNQHGWNARRVFFFWICLGCGNEKVLDLCQSMSLGAKNGSQRAFCRAKHIFWLSKCEAKCVTCQTFLCGGNTYSPHCRVNCCGSAFYHNGSIPRKVRGMVMFVHGCVDSSWAYIYTDLI